VLRTEPAAHWVAVLEEAGVPSSVIHTVADAVEHPQVRARNMIVTADGLRMAGNPVKLSAFADPVSRQPAQIWMATANASARSSAVTRPDN